jgi:DNA-binding NtrC family response regulator
MAKVLLVSYVTELSHEREQVLRSAGYEVTAALTWEAATNAIQQQLYDVAVLGFSVPEDQRTQLAGDLKELNPATRVLMFYFEAVPSTRLADALIPTSANAEEVLRAVHHLLNECRRAKTG